MSLGACSNCGRTFNPESLTKHERICKNSQKPRKVFDSQKQRTRGLDIISTDTRGRPSTTSAPPRQKTLSWKQQHEELIQSIRSAREINEAVKKGAPLPQPVPAAPNPDYVQCSYCQRHFEYNTAQKHIPFCKQQTSRIHKNTPTDSKAKEFLNKRIHYKPPSIKKKSSATSQQTNDHATPPTSRPVGSSVVKQNTNFSKPHRATPIEGNEGGVEETKRKNVRPSSNNDKIQSAAKSESKFRTTAFSRVKKTDVAVVPNSTFNNHEDHSYGKGSQSKGKSVRESSQNKVASRRLFAALEYSDQSGNGEEKEERNTMKSLNGAVYKESLMSKYYTKQQEEISYGPGKSNTVKDEFIHKIGGMVMANDEPFHHSTGHNATHFTSTSNTQNTAHGNGSSYGNGRPLSNDISERIPSDHAFNNSHYQAAGASLHPHTHPTFNPHTQTVLSPHTQSTSIPLNPHGMPMSKFCYECGTKYPVPQAKYCCECGTKRI